MVIIKSSFLGNLKRRWIRSTSFLSSFRISMGSDMNQTDICYRQHFFLRRLLSQQWWDVQELCIFCLLSCCWQSSQASLLTDIWITYNQRSSMTVIIWCRVCQLQCCERRNNAKCTLFWEVFSFRILQCGIKKEPWTRIPSGLAQPLHRQSDRQMEHQPCCTIHLFRWAPQIPCHTIPRDALLLF